MLRSDVAGDSGTRALGSGLYIWCVQMRERGRVRSLHLLFVDCEDSADSRIVEAQEACRRHLAITMGCNSFGDEPVPEYLAWAFL
jgi:hypothetical protein